MNKIKFLPLALVVFLAFSSCKYEEGPFISFVPKQERMTNTWEAEISIEDGEEKIGLDNFKSITFFKEGNCSMILEAGSTEIPYSGEWAFSADKMQVLLDLKDDATNFFTYDQTWDIIRLKEKELWARYIEDSTSYEVHFIPVQ